MDILVRYVFELWRTCTNYWWKKVFQHTVTLFSKRVTQKCMIQKNGLQKTKLSGHSKYFSHFVKTKSSISPKIQPSLLNPIVFYRTKYI